MYIITVTEHLNYGDDKTVYCAKEYDNFVVWMMRWYPDYDEVEENKFYSKEADTTIEVSMPIPID